MLPQVSVIMPVYRQEAFIGRAIGTLLAQTLADWELVIVDDGSPEPISVPVAPFAGDPRIRAVRLAVNRGLGAACNRGLDLAQAPLVAYLPADDILYRDHLAALVAAFSGSCAGMAVTGMRHGDMETLREPVGFAPQLVQVMHRRTGDRWVERPDCESDDLGLLFWSRLRAHGPTGRTGRVTCEWVAHPGQRHRPSLSGMTAASTSSGGVMRSASRCASTPATAARSTRWHCMRACGSAATGQCCMAS